MEPGRQSLSSYHGNRINETGDGGTYADSRESDFSTSAVHLYRWRNGLLGALLWFDQLFAAGRLEQDSPYDGPEWGHRKYQ